MGWQPLGGEALSLFVADLVEGGARSCGELGPPGRTGLFVSRLEESVGDCDLLAGPIDVALAETGGLTVGRSEHSVAVKVGFELEPVVTPDRPAGA